MKYGIGRNITTLLHNRCHRIFSDPQLSLIQPNVTIISEYIYSLEMKLREGYVFTGVCLSTGGGEGGEGNGYDVTSCLAAWCHVPSGEGYDVTSCLTAWSHVPLEGGGAASQGVDLLVLAFWLKVALSYGLLVESDLLVGGGLLVEGGLILWPSG